MVDLILTIINNTTFSLSRKGFVTVVLHNFLKKMRFGPSKTLQEVDVEAVINLAIQDTKGAVEVKSKRTPYGYPYLKAKGTLLQKNHLGLLCEKNTLYLAQLVVKPTGVLINLLTTLPGEIQELAETSHVKPLDIFKENYPKETKKLKKAIITTAFPTLKTIARTIEIDLLKKEMLDLILQYQIEPLLPYELSQCILDKIELKKTGKQQHFLVFSAKKDDLQSHLDEYQALGIDPEIVAPKALGLAQFAKLFFPDSTVRLFIDISAVETTCLLFQNGTPLAIRSLPMTLEADVAATISVEKHLESYARELSRILVGFQNSFPEAKEAPIVFTGTQERDPIILSFLGKLLGYQTEHIQNIPPTVTLGNNISLDDLAAFAAPIGLALIMSPFQNEMAKLKLSINFRKEEFSYVRKWRRWKKDLVLYFILMFALSLFLYNIGEQNLKNKSHDVHEKYLSLLSQLEKTEDEIETAFAKMMNLEKKTRSKEESLSLNELQERFAFIESTLLKRPYEEIALHPNIARVSDLLAWLSSHPKVVQAPPISIESLSYSMLKRPDKEKMKEHYAVRVDLDFTAPTGESAREFYDALNEPNLFVDPKEEVKWSVQRGRYQTSFFLKDRTQYP